MTIEGTVLSTVATCAPQRGRARPRRASEDEPRRAESRERSTLLQKPTGGARAPPVLSCLSVRPESYGYVHDADAVEQMWLVLIAGDDAATVGAAAPGGTLR
jgi:hypothetical protein